MSVCVSEDEQVQYVGVAGNDLVTTRRLNVKVFPVRTRVNMSELSGETSSDLLTLSEKKYLYCRVKENIRLFIALE